MSDPDSAENSPDSFMSDPDAAENSPDPFMSDTDAAENRPGSAIHTLITINEQE